MLLRRQHAHCGCGRCSRAASLSWPHVGLAARQLSPAAHGSGPIAAAVSLQQQDLDLQQQQEQQQQQRQQLAEQQQAAVSPGPRRRPIGPRPRLVRRPTGSRTPPPAAGAATAAAGGGENGNGASDSSSSSSVDAAEAAAGQLVHPGNPAAIVDSAAEHNSSTGDGAGHAQLDTAGELMHDSAPAAACNGVPAAAAAADGAAALMQTPAAALPDIPAAAAAAATAATASTAATATAAKASGAGSRRIGPPKGRIGPPRPKRVPSIAQAAAAAAVVDSTTASTHHNSMLTATGNEARRVSAQLPAAGQSMIEPTTAAPATQVQSAEPLPVVYDNLQQQQQQLQQQQQVQAPAPQPSWKIALQKHQEYQRRLRAQQQQELQQQLQQQHPQQQELQQHPQQQVQHHPLQQQQQQQQQPGSVLAQPGPTQHSTENFLSSPSSTSTSPLPAAETCSKSTDSPGALDSSGPAPAAPAAAAPAAPDSRRVPESDSPGSTASDSPQIVVTQSDIQLTSESDRVPLSESGRAPLSGSDRAPLSESDRDLLSESDRPSLKSSDAPQSEASAQAPFRVPAGASVPESDGVSVHSAAQDAAAQHTHQATKVSSAYSATGADGNMWQRGVGDTAAAAGTAARTAVLDNSASEPDWPSTQSSAPPSSSDNNSNSSSNGNGDGSSAPLSSAASEGSAAPAAAVASQSSAAERRRRRSSRRQTRHSTMSSQADDSISSTSTAAAAAASPAAAPDACPDAGSPAISASDVTVSTSGVTAEPASPAAPTAAYAAAAAPVAVSEPLAAPAAAVTEASQSAAAAMGDSDTAATTASPSPAATASQAAADTATQPAAAAAAAAADTAAQPAAAADTATHPAAAAAAPRRRINPRDSKAPGSTGYSASDVNQLLAGQRKLSKGVGSNGSKAGAANADSSSSSSSSTKAGPAGAITEVKPGVWQLSGFSDDITAMGTLVPALQQRLMAGVQAEQAEEQTAMRKLYAASSLRQLQRDGIVLLQLQATPSHVLYSSMVWRFSLVGAKGRDLPYHRFRQGDSLLVSRFSEDQLVDVGPGNSRSYGMNRASVEGSNDLRPGSNGFRPLDATVVEVRKDHLMLALEKSESDRMQAEVKQAAAAPLVSWRLDQSVRDTTARRQMDAIRRLSQPTSNDVFEGLLRMVLVGTPNGADGAEVPPEWVRDRGWREDTRQLLDQTEGLNVSQKRAIAVAVVRSFTLWQGPPGTGKTRTLLALVEVLVKTAQKQSRRWEAMGPILACGDTNAAVDNLVEGLLDKGLRVVRLGQPAKVRENLRHYTLEAQAAKTAEGRRAEELRKSSKILFEQSKQLAEGSVLSWGNRSRSTGSELTRSSRAKANGGSPVPTAPAGGSSEGLEREAKQKWAEAERLSKRAARVVLQEAQVVCATCSGAGDPLLNDLHFNMVVIDEATQATEPATLVPLTQGARCVVMAGDPAQLPPTVTSQEAAQKYGLTLTLFERLQTKLKLKPMLLNRQYRMNPAISGFPSHRFYQGKLKDGVSADQKPAAAGLPWPQQDQPVMVLPVVGVEEQAKRGKNKGADGSDQLLYGQAAAAAAGGLMESSYRNLQEAQVTLQAVYALMTAGDAQTAAILTPYKGQVRAFEHALRVLSAWFTPELLSSITVSSVDGYQGREADVVLFSAVRCNQQGRIGFVSDRRRLNVAITRPRRGLVVVCSPETLEKGSDDWAAFMSWCREQQWVTHPRIVPAAPWQLQEVDPFAPGQGEGVSSLSSAEDVR